MGSIPRERSMFGEIFPYEYLELSTTNIIPIGRRDVLSWLIDTQPALELSIARAKVGQITKELPRHIVHILPPANYVLVDQYRHVECQCLCYYSW